MARSGAKQTAIRGLLGGGGQPVSEFTETGPDSYHASFAEALTKLEIHIKCEGMGRNMKKLQKYSGNIN